MAKKALAFILACLCLCAAVYQALSLLSRTDAVQGSLALESLLYEDYTASSTYAQEVDQAIWIIRGALHNQELTASDSLWLDERVWFYAVMTPQPVPSIEDYSSAMWEEVTTSATTSAALEVDSDTVDYQGEPVFIVTVEPPEENRAVTFSNTSASTPAQLLGLSIYHYFYEHGDLQSAYEGTRWIYQNIDDGDERDITLYMVFQEPYVAARQEQWNAARSDLIPGVTICAALVGLALLLVVYLSFVAGRRPGSEELHLSRLDSIYSDLLLCLIVAFGGAWITVDILMVKEMLYSGSSGAVTWFAVLLTAICTPCILALWLSVMRKIKAGRLLRHSLIWSICSAIWRAIRWVFGLIGRFFSGLFGGKRFRGYPFARALFARQTTFIVLSFVMVLGFFVGIESYSTWLSFGCLALELVLIYYFVRTNNRDFADVEKIAHQVFEIYQGNMEYDPGIDPESQLYDTACQLMDVGAGMEKAMQRQLQSERMKINLVTNVSHDLKTPLTSIIGYIDLLQRDEGLSPEARDYVTILASKSQRLKTIIEDLFDLAKTTSGDENSLHMEVLDLKRLVEQTLADMDDQIERSGQPVRTALPELPVFAMADGRKLYRVFQNIMDNALKYSMPGTRIYVSMTVSDMKARVVVKNTSSYEMDFTSDEILERFVRGDKSRTTEGSGLGLSIADGFTRALGGELRVSIDGDQFRVELVFPVTLPRSAEPEEEEPQEPLPPGMRDRMDLLRGKLYKPQEGAPPKRFVDSSTVRLSKPPEPQFEPERPVELEELESVLSAFDTGAWRTDAVPAGRQEDGDADEQGEPAGDRAEPAADPDVPADGGDLAAEADS